MRFLLSANPTYPHRHGARLVGITTAVLLQLRRGAWVRLRRMSTPG